MTLVTTSCSRDRQTGRGVSNQEKNHQLRVSGAAGCTGENEETVCQHHPRHVDVLVKDLRLEQADSVQTPATHNVTEEELEPLDQVQHSRERSQVARCLFFSQDRAVITFIANELCQKMSNPTQHSLAQLKRLVRCLKREREWEHILNFGIMVEELTTFSDSDWAGCKETRKTSSAGVTLLILLGHPESRHTQAR